MRTRTQEVIIRGRIHNFNLGGRESSGRKPGVPLNTHTSIDMSVWAECSKYTNGLTHIQGIGRRRYLLRMSNHQNRHSSQTHRGILLLALSSGYQSLAMKLQYTYDT